MYVYKYVCVKYNTKVNADLIQIVLTVDHRFKHRTKITKTFRRKY